MKGEVTDPFPLGSGPNSYYDRICTEIVERLGPKIASVEGFDETMWAVIEEDLCVLFDNMVVEIIADKEGGDEPGVFIHLAVFEPFDWYRNVRLRDALISRLADIEVGKAMMHDDDWDAIRELATPNEDDSPGYTLMRKLLMVFVEEKAK